MSEITVLDMTTGQGDTLMAGGGIEGADRFSREMMRWNPPVISPAQQVFEAKGTSDARSQDMVQNNGMTLGAVATHRDSIVGSQYMLNAKPVSKIIGGDDVWEEEFQEVVEARFNLISDSPDNWFDAQRVNTLTGLIRLGIAQFLMTGEVLGTVEWLRQANRPFNTAIQMISPVRLSNPDGDYDTRSRKSGIEMDYWGAPLGYHIRNGFPNDPVDDMEQWRWTYVPARKPWGRKQVIHIIEQLLPSQPRGISEMVSVLKDMHMTKRFKEVTLQNAVVNASYAAAIESELPSEVVFSQMGAGGGDLGAMLGQYMSALQAYSNNAKNIALDGVKIPHFFPGTKLNLKPMGTPGGVGSDFEASLLRHISSALGMSYEQFSRDYTKTNYSSARASMAETWKFMQSRKKMVADKLASEIYLLWLEEEIAKGNVPLPRGFKADDFYKPMMRDAFSACTWIGAARGQIDELKETNAAVARINNLLSTREDEIARLGGDYRAVLKQQAREAAAMKRLGLTPVAEAGANTQTSTQNRAEPQNDPKDDEQ